MRRDDHHRPVLNLGVLLLKAVGLCRQAVVEARIRVHLHLQEHHRKLGAAGFPAACALPGPENAIEAVAQLLELQCLKALQAIARFTGVEAQRVGSGS